MMLEIIEFSLYNYFLRERLSDESIKNMENYEVEVIETPVDINGQIHRIHHFKHHVDGALTQWIQIFIYDYDDGRYIRKFNFKNNTWTEWVAPLPEGQPVRLPIGEE